MDAEDSTTGFVDCAFSLDFLFPPMGCGTRQLKQGKLNEALTVFNMVRGPTTTWGSKRRLWFNCDAPSASLLRLARHSVMPLYQE